MAEPIEMPFGVWIGMTRRNHVLHGIQIPTHEGTILSVKMGQPQNMPIHTQSCWAGGSISTMRMPIGMY